MVERLTISNDLFVDFIKKSTLEGEIPQLLLTQTEGGYEVNVSQENVITCEGLLFKKNFLMFGKLGNITIKDTKRFIMMMKDITGNVTMERKENKIVMYGEKTEVEYVLCSEEFIETTLPQKIDIKFDDGFKIGKDFFIKLVVKALLLEVGTIKIQVKDNILRGIAEETDKFIVKEEVPYKDCESDYGMWLFKLSKFLEDKVDVSFDTNYPVSIISKNTNFSLKYIIAPFVNTDDSIGEVEEKKKESVGNEVKKDGKETG